MFFQFLMLRYIAAKKECERLLKSHWSSNPSRLRIVRISVAIGDRRLLHDKLLRRIAPFASLLPDNMRRCFIHVNELCQAVQASSKLSTTSIYFVFAAVG